MQFNYDHQLAQKHGLNEKQTMFLNRFFYFTATNLKNGKGINGNECWVYIEGGQEQLSKDNYFPQWSTSTIKRIIKGLIEKNCIKLENRNKYGWNTTKSFCVNPDKFQNEILKVANSFPKSKTAAAAQPTPTPAPSDIPTQPKPKKESREVFKELAEKVKTDRDEIKEIGTTVFNAYFLKAFGNSYEGWNDYTLQALNEIMNKVHDKVLSKSNKQLNQKDLLIELDWFFYAAYTELKDKKRKFNTIYILTAFDRILDIMLEEDKKNRKKSDKNKRQHPKQVIKLHQKM